MTEQEVLEFIARNDCTIRYYAITGDVSVFDKDNKVSCPIGLHINTFCLWDTSNKIVKIGDDRNILAANTRKFQIYKLAWPFSDQGKSSSVK